jgi:type I restriction enzyme, S subunit
MQRWRIWRRGIAREEGMLPKDWKKITVAEACETVSVGIVVNPSSYYVNAGKGIRAFRSGNVRDNKVNNTNWVYLSAEGNKKNKKSILRTGDVLVVRTGFAGTSCVVPQDFAGSNCIDILFARPKPSILIPEYLSQLTNSELGRKQVFAGQNGLAQKHLNVSSYEKMSFGLPSIEEQRRIAEVLAGWDSAINATELLLTSSRRLKQALDLQLLKGKKRLASFGKSGIQATPHGPIPEDWAYPKIGEIAEEISERNTDKQNYPVLSCTKHSGLVDSRSYFTKQVFSKDLSTYKVVPRASFAYATNHIEEGSIGYQNLYDSGLVSPMYTVFHTSAKVYDGYLYRILKTEHFRQIFEASTNASVDRRGSLRWNEFKKLHVPLPSLIEQKAITKVLELADKEIALLQKKIEKLRNEKTALMQALLTGKRRVTLDKE